MSDTKALRICRENCASWRRTAERLRRELVAAYAELADYVQAAGAEADAADIARAELAKALELLREAEWAKERVYNYGCSFVRVCFCCGEEEHHHSCELAALLRRHPDSEAPNG